MSYFLIVFNISFCAENESIQDHHGTEHALFNKSKSDFVEVNVNRSSLDETASTGPLRVRRIPVPRVRNCPLSGVTRAGLQL